MPCLQIRRLPPVIRSFRPVRWLMRRPAATCAGRPPRRYRQSPRRSRYFMSVQEGLRAAGRCDPSGHGTAPFEDNARRALRLRNDEVAGPEHPDRGPSPRHVLVHVPARDAIAPPGRRHHLTAWVQDLDLRADPATGVSRPPHDGRVNAGPPTTRSCSTHFGGGSPSTRTCRASST